MLAFSATPRAFSGLKSARGGAAVATQLACTKTSQRIKVLWWCCWAVAGNVRVSPGQELVQPVISKLAMADANGMPATAEMQARREDGIPQKNKTPLNKYIQSLLDVDYSKMGSNER